VALCQARISTKPLWGFSSSNPYHSQSRAEQLLTAALTTSFAFLQYVKKYTKNLPNLVSSKENEQFRFVTVSFLRY
jgi:hypothetical protein